MLLLTRSILIEKDEERHFKPENYSYSLTFYIDNDIHYEDWSHRSQKEFLDVITHFPLQSFCQAVRLQKTKGNGYGDYTFLSYFFRLLDTLVGCFFFLLVSC